MTRGPRLQPRHRPLREAPEHGQRRGFLGREPRVQLAIELVFEVILELQVVDFVPVLEVVLPLPGVQVQRPLPQQADAP